MSKLKISFIIPVYNRPNEVNELLESFTNLDGNHKFEVIIIEDGSTISSEFIVQKFKDKLNLFYYFKPNTGPGDSRNYGMQKARGNYFIILDSDVILPSKYLEEVKTFLETNYYDCFGGPDTTHHSFTNLQKAIDFAMTSFISTGGIRGGQYGADNFQPRSFNMGLSKDAFIASNGFGKIHPGEDPDLVLRLHTLGFKTVLIKDAFVYHKRRVSWSEFYKQVYKFGMVRAILNMWHPQSKRVTYWFPTIFSLGFIISFLLFLFGIKIYGYLYMFYFCMVFAFAFIKNKSIVIAIQSIVAIGIQFLGYGFGFLKSTFILSTIHKDPKKAFPNLFFK